MNIQTKKVLKYISIVILLLFIALIATFQYSRSWKNAYFIDPIYKIHTDEKIVALTFDDGPSNVRTPALLDLLDKYDIKATFFMLGENIEKYPEVAKNVYERGHLIGNHSYNHPRLIFKSPSFVKEQINSTEKLIKSTGQEDISYFRPPYTSKYIVLPLILKSMDKKLVSGTYDPPSEYSNPYKSEEMAKEVIDNIEPGAIIYLHDGNSKDPEGFIKGVELVITGLQEKGYEFVRLDYKE